MALGVEGRVSFPRLARLPTSPHGLLRSRDVARIANDIASNIAGKEDVYSPEPWFWSDQYDMKLQIAGLNRGYDQVVTRAGKREGSVSHFYFTNGNFIAVDCMNDGAVYALCRRLLAAGKPLSPKQVADPDFNLKSLL